MANLKCRKYIFAPNVCKDFECATVRSMWQQDSNRNMISFSKLLFRGSHRLLFDFKLEAIALFNDP